MWEPACRRWVLATAVADRLQASSYRKTINTGVSVGAGLPAMGFRFGRLSVAQQLDLSGFFPGLRGLYFITLALRQFGQHLPGPCLEFAVLQPW